jgi:hypothetical protein
MGENENNRPQPGLAFNPINGATIGKQIAPADIETVGLGAERWR